VSARPGEDQVGSTGSTHRGKRSFTCYDLRMDGLLRTRAKRLLCVLPALAACQSIADSPIRHPNVSNSSECEILIAVARDGLDWGHKSEDATYLSETAEYKADCNWQAAGLFPPAAGRVWSITVSRPKLWPDLNHASTNVNYLGHVGSYNLLCKAQRVDGQWRGQSCTTTEDEISKTIGVMVSNAKLIGQSCSTGNAHLKSGGNVETLEDYECTASRSAGSGVAKVPTP
jgi:hypothetical protein